ncbi:MAG: helix-turn-helix transcriptional regulator [Treponema sp.]|nr:helix-turn-helix transcriptional regulator [Treponema sp.]
MEYCPLENALKILGGKWKIPILCALQLDGPTRYIELKRKIRGITNAMLASSLLHLWIFCMNMQKIPIDGHAVLFEYSEFARYKYS